MQLDEEYRNIPYFIRHTKDITDRAGVITMDSPYISIEEKEEQKKKKVEKKISAIKNLVASYQR